MDKYRHVKTFSTGETATQTQIGKHHGILIRGTTETTVGGKMLEFGGTFESGITLTVPGNDSRFFPIQLSSITSITGTNGTVNLLY